jgi:hypothetical protein
VSEFSVHTILYKLLQIYQRRDIPITNEEELSPTTGKICTNTWLIRSTAVKENKK